jgi:ParB family chromosome partitioning protein
MNAKKNRLGRGLDALLGDMNKHRPEDAVSATDTQDISGASRQPTGQTAQKSPYKEIPVDLLDTGSFQPRTHMDDQALEELAGSIKAQGLIQPILVRASSGGRYEILAGHRRWRASQLAGLERIPAVVKDVSDEAALAVALIENIQREDLNPIEQAQGLKRLMDEFGLTHQEVASSIGRSRTAVTNLLRLLGLNSKVRDCLENGELDMGHARALLPLEDMQQISLANMIISHRLSVRETEKKVRQLQTGTPKSRVTHLVKDTDLLRLESELSDRLAAKVNIVPGRKKGKLVIEYHSLDELDGILKRIN